MLKERIGIVGLGNMGGALLRGLKKADLISGRQVILFDKEPFRLDQLAKELGFPKASGNRELVQKSQGVILAVKPQDISQVLKETAEDWRGDKFIISIAAGITISFIEKKVKQALGVIRAMPNTPARIGAGITAISFNRLADLRPKEAAKSIFRAFGEVIEVEESAMDLVTALSGSGPAYFFLIMEALIEAGQSLGLAKITAEKLIKETALGAAGLAKEIPGSLSELRENVTSPGGTTEAALEVFKKADLKKIIFQAVKAAREKAKILSLNSE